MNKIGTVIGESKQSASSVRKLAITLSDGATVDRECYCNYDVNDGLIDPSSIEFVHYKPHVMLNSMDVVGLTIDGIKVNL